MTDAIFGLLGVIIGAMITWLQQYWTNKQDITKKARYLAIRVVCILDKYIENCVEVVTDDGLCDGQRTKEGYLVPQVDLPDIPVFPDDIDWKSISYDLMYQILSFPSDIEAADNKIAVITEYAAFPPDYEELFEERVFQYSQLGLKVYELTKKLRKTYQIPDRNYKHWNPVSELKSAFNDVQLIRAKRQKQQTMDTLFFTQEIENK